MQGILSKKKLSTDMYQGKTDPPENYLCFLTIVVTLIEGKINIQFFKMS
jgi:hypothetical protein